MTVRAKFVVTSHADIDGKTQVLRLNAVESGSEENKEFFKYTPSGEIRFGTVNPAVKEALPLGKEFYVDFIPVDS